MDDAVATRACGAGNLDACRHLVDRYQARALAHARLLTRNHADAADATQEAFIDAFRNLNAFDPARPFYAWFYVLLRNRCFKQQSRRGTRSESGVAPELVIDPAVSEGRLDLWRAIVLGLKALSRRPRRRSNNAAGGRGWPSVSRPLMWCWS